MKIHFKNIFSICSTLQAALVLAFSNMNVQAQVALKPSIGLNSLPADSTPICYIPTYIDPDMTFETPGLHNGDTIPDFKLYTVDGDSMQISELLKDGKPVLLVGGSYTCPIYRNHVSDINDIVTLFGNQIHVYVV
ncbi:MAG: hypothetical protein ACHQD9_05865, partial [Chitinophagales bacterium]